MADPRLEGRERFMARVSILALFCFELFIKISLNLLTYFYIIRGNREEVARISAQYYEKNCYSHAGCVEVLLTWGADVDQVLPGQGTALYSACLSQELLCVQQLLRDGADVQRGRGLDSPLHATAQIGHAPITRLMLEFDADVQALNAEHQRAVELAPPGGSTETLLLAHEATPTSLSRKCRQVVRCSVGHSTSCRSSPSPPRSRATCSTDDVESSSTSSVYAIL
ncbi:unnamed protein product [Boreogadus saida]